jgi:hypothetical protein
MTAMQISCVGCAVTSFTVGYEMLGILVFSKYGTFILKVKILWNAENGDLQIIYINIYYLNFPKMCFAGLGTMAKIMQEDKTLVIKSKMFLHVL